MGFAELRSIVQSLRLHEIIVDDALQCCRIYIYIKEAQNLFDKMLERNIMGWIAIINGLAVQGRAREALRMFDEIKKLGLRPDCITFSAVLVD